MPLIKARTQHVRSVRHVCRLQEPKRDALLLYAQFIGDTADHVLNEALEATILKDRDFLAWRAEQPSARPAVASERHPTRTSQTDDAI